MKLFFVSIITFTAVTYAVPLQQNSDKQQQIYNNGKSIQVQDNNKAISTNNVVSNKKNEENLDKDGQAAASQVSLVK